MKYKIVESNCQYCEKVTHNEIVGLSEGGEYFEMVCCECAEPDLGLIVCKWDIEYFLGPTMAKLEYKGVFDD